MEYIKITRENIEKEHICCAMSGTQAQAKKEWLKARFDEGLVFYRSVERGKCFIEYIPAENAWVPIDAPDYTFINCLWIAGAMKGHGYSNDLLDKCMEDSRAQGRKGICILSSQKKKKEFLSDQNHLEYKGFKVADVSECGITLMYLALENHALIPKFKECAKHPKTDEKGIVIYYTDQCPFTNYWVERVEDVAKGNGIILKTVHVTDKQSARSLPAPVINYALFKDGEFITHAIQSDKKFLEIAKK